MAAYPPTPRSQFFEALAAEIEHNYGRGRAIVAVDGAVGTERFADDLALSLRNTGRTVIRARLDDFQLPSEARLQRGPDSAEGYYFDRYDYTALKRVLIEPFRLGGSAGFVTAQFDTQRDAVFETRWVTAPKDALLVISGPFLQRPKLRGVFHFVAFLESSTAILNPVVAEAHELYRAEVQPRVSAGAIVSIREEDHPKREFADRC
ncbi:nucleoside/nucleotide kinase family protein [Subtercola frigoramans]|uniref:Uridine kinase n=1 Tax=Subtercola frigoramans TaxID=120298 RepID=A0ABS2L4M3_9MICO|nr:hypothetical protein [Subtercola frigoramans]MBM7471984.1 uridine kinase [Subtercola frigoramans]